MCMLCIDLSPSYVIYQTSVASELSRMDRTGVLWQTQNVMTNGNLCLESASGKRRKPYGARERCLRFIAAARDLLSPSRNCTGEGEMEQQTDMGHLKHLHCVAKKCGLSVLSSPHCRASEHGFTFQLELPAIREMEGSNHYAKSPTQIDMAFMGPPRPPTEGGRREQPFMPHNDGRTDGCRMWRCEPNGRGRGRGRAFPFRSLPRGLVGSGHRARGAHMPPHSPPTDHKMTRDSRWIQLTKRTTQEDAGRIIEFPRRYFTKRKVST